MAAFLAASEPSRASTGEAQRILSTVHEATTICKCGELYYEYLVMSIAKMFNTNCRGIRKSEREANASMRRYWNEIAVIWYGV